MLPDPVLAPDPEIDSCRRLLLRCAAELSAEGRRLHSLGLTSTVGGSCAVALAAAAAGLARELLALGEEIEEQAGRLRRGTGR